MIPTRLIKRLAAGLAALALVGSTANANTITPLLNTVNAPGGWAYDAYLSSGELHAGDGFAIFDFGGYVSGSIFAPVGWSASVAAFGSPYGASIGPDTGDVNLIFTYTGASFENVTGTTWLGLFGAITTSLTIETDDWRSQDHLIGRPFVIDSPGLAPIQGGGILVPGNVPQNRVPEGGLTAALVGFALSGVAFLRRRA